MSKDSRQTSNLPAPGADLLGHSERVLDHILAEIQATGPISFARYMELALYAPGLGYYSAGATKFGTAGDFVTAPLLGDLFAGCVARQVAQIHQALNGFSTIVELGAGTGELAADLLLSLDQLDCLPQQYWILDRSADLIARQRERIQQLPAHLASLVSWLDEPPAGPFEGVVLANEVLDALPVHRFVVTEDGLKEQFVDCTNGQLSWHLDAPSAALSSAVEEIQAALPERLAVGYESEVLLHCAEWIESLTANLDRGAALLIDYGYPRREYYHAQRRTGTVVCHYRHRGHNDPFFLPGGQDITAFVDFTNVAWAADACGFDVAGFTTQAHFLLSLGLTELISPDSSEQVQQVKRLTLPADMGEKFKVMALLRNLELPLRGFMMDNRLDRL